MSTKEDNVGNVTEETETPEFWAGVKQYSESEMKDLIASGAPTSWNDKELVSFQLYQQRLCTDLKNFHRALEQVLARPVYTHEFASPELLQKEFEGKIAKPTQKEIFDRLKELIGTENVIVIDPNSMDAQTIANEIIGKLGSIPCEPRPTYQYAKKSVLLELAGEDSDDIRTGDKFIIEDWWINLGGKSWMVCNDNPACIKYAIRSKESDLPPDNDVLYGKIRGFGHLVHVTELGELVNDEPTPNTESDQKIN